MADPTKDPNSPHYIPKEGDPPSAFEHFRNKQNRCIACHDEIDITDVQGQYSGECEECREG